MDRRTLRAAAVAELSTFLVISSLGWFLGFDLAPSLIAGAIFGTAAFLLIFLAARRAETFESTLREQGNDRFGD